MKARTFTPPGTPTIRRAAREMSYSLPKAEGAPKSVGDQIQTLRTSKKTITPISVRPLDFEHDPFKFMGTDDAFIENGKQVPGKKQNSKHRLPKINGTSSTAEIHQRQENVKFSYRRELTGVVGVDWYKPTVTRLDKHGFKPFMWEYLVAHGYSDEAMAAIWRSLEISNSCEMFSTALQRKGMAQAECQWIWKHDQNTSL